MLRGNQPHGLKLPFKGQQLVELYSRPRFYMRLRNLDKDEIK